jgi:hypothetical protein
MIATVQENSSALSCLRIVAMATPDFADSSNWFHPSNALAALI